MSAPVLSIIILAVMFLLATVLPLNMGALAFVGASCWAPWSSECPPMTFWPTSPAACS